MIIKHEILMYQMCCTTCGVPFMFPDDLWEHRTGWINANGLDNTTYNNDHIYRDLVYCPNGHINKPAAADETLASKQADVRRAHMEEQLEAANAELKALKESLSPPATPSTARASSNRRRKHPPRGAAGDVAPEENE